MGHGRVYIEPAGSRQLARFEGKISAHRGNIIFSDFNHNVVSPSNEFLKCIVAEVVQKKRNESISTAPDPGTSNLQLDLGRLLLESDSDKNGRVDLKEFRKHEKAKSISPETSASQFKFFDVDGDGAITPHDDIDGNAKIDIQDRGKFLTRPNKAVPYGAIGPIYKVQRNNGLEQETKHISASDQEAEYMRDKMSQIKTGPPIEITNTMWAKSKVYSYNVPITDLDPRLEGLKILHISDLHFDQDRDQKRFQEFKTLISKLPAAPDIIVATGDFIENSSPGFNNDVVRYLKALYPGVPKFAVLGNHDYFYLNEDPEVVRHSKPGSAPIVQKKLEEGDFSVLRNHNVRIMHDGAPVNITGVDDQDVNADRPPLAPVSPPNELGIYLTHNLDTLNNSVPKNYDLVLSGHTHSGEMDLFVVNGIDYLKQAGDFENLNDQIRGFKPLTWRTTSYISPGFARRMGVRLGSKIDDSGISLLSLTNAK